MSNCSYVIVTGGIFSGTGKGVSAASIALLMKMRGLNVQLFKQDNYLNVSPSTISPAHVKGHGEIYILNNANCDEKLEGTSKFEEVLEADLDLGTYERITGLEMTSRNVCTGGKLYSTLIEEEREGKYLGDTIQVVPHLTRKVQEMLIDIGKGQDIVVAELGGTVDDWEAAFALEAIREFKHKLGDKLLLVHVAPILWLNTVNEFKTKPLQKSVKELRSFGLNPDILLCRVDRPVPNIILDKISSLTGIDRDVIFDAPDVKSVYEVPIAFYDRHIDDTIADMLKLKRNGVRIHKYRELVEKYTNAKDMPEITIGVVGKYADSTEAYLSLKEAIYHAGVSNNYKVNIKWIQSEKLEEYSTIRGVGKFFEDVNGIVIAGGFDSRGILGKIKAIEYAREKKVPLLGICLGLQCAVIEFARNVCGIQNADSVEFKTEGITPVIHFVPGLEHIRRKGGTLRLGSYDCVLSKDSIAFEVYGKKNISERHRHRYEVNNEYSNVLQSKGLMVTGTNPQTGLIEIMELDRKVHPYFITVQFHPEFKSRLTSPHPLFDKLIYCSIHGSLDKKPEETDK